MAVLIKSGNYMATHLAPFNFFISYVGYAFEGAPYLLSPSVPFKMFKIIIYTAPNNGININSKFHPLLLISWRRLIVTENDGIKSTKLYTICKTPSEVGSIRS